ncbi:MAG: peptidylprolyl isomerase [Rhizobiaceae bacterium]|nr:peptidylprolyl isomerase [Rhizobiaceae bacterium]
MDVNAGRIEIELLPQLAPAHVERIKTLVGQGFYDGIVFHRVINGFMAQTGDPTGTGRGGSDLPDLKAEFSNEPFVRGILGMARSQSPNSANSQFFIMFAPGDFLNGKYTVFGRVVKGMEFVDAIKKGDQANNGAVSDPDKIIKMQMAP